MSDAWIPTHVCINRNCTSWLSPYSNPFCREPEYVGKELTCDLCGNFMYTLEKGSTQNNPEIILFQNEHWRITKRLYNKAGWIIGDCTGDQWVQYEDGTVGYDNPFRLPMYVKAQLMVELCKFDKLWGKE